MLPLNLSKVILDCINSELQLFLLCLKKKKAYSILYGDPYVTLLF